MTARHCLKCAFILTLLVTLAPLPSQAAKGSACTMTQATIARDEAGIRETMAAYNAALNGGKTAAVLPLYTEDGVFMPPTADPRSARARSPRPTTRCSQCCSVRPISRRQAGSFGKLGKLVSVEQAEALI